MNEYSLQYSRSYDQINSSPFYFKFNPPRAAVTANARMNDGSCQSSAVGICRHPCLNRLNLINSTYAYFYGIDVFAGEICLQLPHNISANNYNRYRLVL